jgi:hypothetical protein
MARKAHQAKPRGEEVKGGKQAFLLMWIGMGIVLGVVFCLDAIFSERSDPGAGPSRDGSYSRTDLLLMIIFGLEGWAFVAYILLSLSMLPIGLLWVLLALVQAKWGPARQPWFAPPAGAEQTRWRRFILHNLPPLGQKAKVTGSLVILLAGLGLAAFELHKRLASGNWPRSDGADSPSGISTVLLAVAVFYVLLSLLELVRMVWRRLSGVGHGQATHP